MSQFEEYFERSCEVSTVSKLRRLYSDTVRSEGYENLIFTSVRGRDVANLHWLEFPDGYPEYYFENQWEKIDPILSASLRARRPFCWNEVAKSPALSKPQRALLDECRDIGVHSGIAFPFHGPGNQLDILSISRRTEDPANPENLGLLHMITNQTLARFSELTGEVSFPELDEIVLTDRELEVLRWSKAGKSYADIAEILSISRKTVEFHLRNAMDKLGANNKISAVVMAIHRGLIEL